MVAIVGEWCLDASTLGKGGNFPPTTRDESMKRLGYLFMLGSVVGVVVSALIVGVV
jgi:hypothetical protein